MANPFGDNVDDALRAAERLLGRLDESAQRVERAATEAQRQGTRLRVPTTREPVAPASPASETAGTLRGTADGARRAAENLVRLRQEADGAMERLNRSLRVVERQAKSGAAVFNVVDPQGNRAPGTGNFRSREAAEFRRAEALVPQGPTLPENARYVAAFRDASDQVRRLADEMVAQRRIVAVNQGLGTHGPERRQLLALPAAGQTAQMDVDREALRLTRTRGAQREINLPGHDPRRGAIAMGAVTSETQRLANLEGIIEERRGRSLGLLSQARIEAVGMREALRETAVFRPALPTDRRTIDDEEQQRRQRDLLYAQRRRDLRALPAAGQTAQMPTSPFIAGITPPPDRSGSGQPPQRPPDQRAFFGRPVTEARVQDFGGADLEEQRAAYQRWSRSVNDAIAVERQLPEQLRRTGIEANRTNAEMAGVSQRLRAHGAATTEFLSALARGNASIEETGWQAIATAGKFAAWTAASVGVYGALTGVAQVGEGAISSMSGVNEASRFINNLDTDSAQAQFRQLAREMNLPIDQVVEAYSGMGRVFNSQEGAMEGARQVLLATRVGELEVADATRFLGAIVQGFGLQASDLPTVLDQINQAQNRLNFSVRDGTAGIARAAGSWRAAGGSFGELLAIMATAQRATGATGEVVGTAFRRSAEFIGREENQARLRAFGIDPRQNVDQIYRQAFQLVESGQVQGQDITRLATALSSPQLAATIGPTLQRFELFNRALAETNAQAARGSAPRELAIQLGSVREEIARVGTGFQELGSNLAQSGSVSGLVLMLETVNQLLRLTNNLIGTFNELPAPIRYLTTGLLQAYGVMRLMRRLNVGDFLQRREGDTLGAQGARQLGGVVAGNPQDVAFRRLRDQLGQEEEVLRQQAAQQGIAASRATAASRRAAQEAAAQGDMGADPARIAALQREFQDRGVDESTAARQAALRAEGEHQQRVKDLSARSATLADQAAEESRKLEHIRRDQADIEERNRSILARGRQSAEAGLEEARRFDINQPISGLQQDINRPTTQPLGPVPGRDEVLRGASGVPDTTALPGGVTPPVVVRQTAVAAEEQGRVNRDMVREQFRLRDAFTTAGWAPLVNAIRDTDGKASGVRGAMGAAGAGLRGLALTVGSLLGPIEVAIAAAIGVPWLIDKIQDSNQRQREQLERFRNGAFAARAERERIAEEADRVNTAAATPAFGGRAGVGPRRPTDTSREAAEFTVQEAHIRRLQEEARNRRRRNPNEAVPFLDLDEIQTNLGRDLINVVQGPDRQRQAAALQRRTAEQIRRSRAGVAVRELTGQANEAEARGDIEEADRLRERAFKFQDSIDQALSDANARIITYLDPGSAADVMRSQSLAEVATEIERMATAISIFGTDQGRLTSAATAFIIAGEALGDRTDPQRMEEFLRAQQSFEGSVQNAAAEYERSFSQAGSAQGQERAFTRYISSLRRIDRDARREVRVANQQVRERRQAEAEARRQRDEARDQAGQQNPFAGQGLLGDPLADANDQALRRREQALAEATRQRRVAQERARGAARARSVQSRITNEQRQGAITDFFQGNELADARLGLANAQTSDPAQRARNTASSIQSRMRVLRRLVRKGIVDESQSLVLMLNLQAQEAEALEAESQAVLDRAISRIENRTRREVAGAPEASQGGIRMRGLRDQLAAAQEHGADEGQIDDLKTQIVEQDRQNADDAKRRAEELRAKRRESISSLFDLRRSRTDDPIKTASLDEQEAVRLGATAGNQNERRSAEAQRNRATRTKAEERHNREIEDARLFNDIGRISDEQLAATYERAIRDRRTGTEYRRKLRNDLLRLRHQMNNEADFANIDVGNVRLPTVYDIRRMMGQGTRTMVQQNQVAITIDGSDSPEATARAVRDVLTGTGAAGLRSGGMT